ncbi:hypothetical protein AB838_01000 [Rhodobacteraceae bacterium (ex Bugula neritina AB1)]|nr:hypothetical protein AB838_01000 [Rhodobacteraceae bacterium (ex Bugula neritina AB1)]
MRTTAKLMGASLIAIAAAGQSAQAQEACQVYEVQANDNLREITEKAYGHSKFRVIYNANRDVIGRNPNVIEIGMRLVLPCADGSLPAEAVAAEAVAEEAEVLTAAATKAGTEAPQADAQAETQAETQTETGVETLATAEQAETQAAPAAAEPMVLITGNDFPPFTGEDLPGRGMFTQLIETAALRSASDTEVSVTFVNDWESHLETLLPAMAFEGSFPWLKPDCEEYAVLSEGDKVRCDSYRFSDPFYEIVDGFFAATGSVYADAFDYGALKGARICRPEGYSMAHLDTVGLTAETVKFYRPVQISECFTALTAGAVDVVALDTLVASDTLATMGLAGQIKENPNLGEVKSLHAIVHKDHPRADETLDLLNRGLKEMSVSGEWYAIISKALQSEIRPLTN